MMIKTESKPRKPAQHFRAGIGEAFNFARHTGPVGGLLILLGLISFMGLRYEILMPVYAREMLHGGPREFGLLMGASGVGAILGSLSTGHTRQREIAGRLGGLCGGGLRRQSYPAIKVTLFLVVACRDATHRLHDGDTVGCL